MTDKEIRDAIASAVVELKKTTQGYLKSNGQPRATVGEQWKKGLDYLAQIDAVPVPSPSGDAPLWNADLSTGNFSQYGAWEFGGTFDSTPTLSDRVTVAASLDGFSPAQGQYLMRIRVAPGDQYGGSTGWRTMCRLPPEVNGNLILRSAGYDSSYTWAVLIPSGYDSDADVWLNGIEWHHTGTAVAPHHFTIHSNVIAVDVFGGSEMNKTTYVNQQILSGYEKGVWHVFTERYKHGLSPNGHYELWHGQKGVSTAMRQLVSAPSIGTMYQGFQNYQLLGIYRNQTGSSTLVSYYGGFREYAALSDALAWGNQIL